LASVTHDGLVLVMGVAGSGKTSVGRVLAAKLGAAFIEADDYHSAANLERLHHGMPLDDAARAPWLRAVHEAVMAGLAEGHGVVLACSALKAPYREVLLAGIPDALVVYLRVARAILEHRLRDRPGEFMVPLLDSQLRELEEPRDALVVDETRSVAATVDEILRLLLGR
jgi:carbohydrate kinase (thermoresistant glucokinase family)